MRTSNTEQDGPPGCTKLLHLWEKTWGPLPPRFIDSFLTNKYTLLICAGVLVRSWSWETVAYFVVKHKKLKKVAECLREGEPPQMSGTPVPRKPSPSPVSESTSERLEEDRKSSKVKMNVVITSELDQSFHTWQVLGAKEPRGKVKTSLLPADIKIGDSLDVEAEHGIDGISVTAAIRPKEKRNNSVELDLLGPNKEEPLISISLVEQEKSSKRKFKGKLPKPPKGFNPSRRHIATRLGREEGEDPPGDKFSDLMRNDIHDAKIRKGRPNWEGKPYQ